MPPRTDGQPHPPAAGVDYNTGTFSRVLLTGLGGSVEPPTPGLPPLPPVGAPKPAGARERTVATTRRLAARVGALRGDEKTALLAVVAVVGVVLLMLAILIVVVRLAGGDSSPAPAAAAAPSPTAGTSASTAASTAPSPTAEPTPSPTGSPLPPSGGSFASRHSNLCLAAPLGRTDAGAQLVQRTCGTDFGTGFLLVATDQPDTYELVNSGTSRCADVLGASVDDGAPVVQWDCNGGPSQTFQLRPLTDTTGADTGYVRIVAAHSGKCLDVTGISADEGAPIQQFTCRDPGAEIDPAAGNQSWKFIAD
jgi:Na+-transporting methylmalonyl-CoA/oxaloacetate decarboxylase gamma subunit